MNLDFSDGLEPIPKDSIQHGPDVLRPSSSVGRYGSGKSAFFYTKHPDNKGKRLHVFGAEEGHEENISRPDVLKGIFGPNLKKIKPAITYMKTIYGDSDPDTGGYKELGKETAYDHWKIRLYAMKDNLIGRHGFIDGVEVLMFWGIPQNDGWDMLNDVIDQMHVVKNTRIINGSDDLGPVWRFKEEFKKAGDLKKKLTVNQDMDRLRAMAQYHVATGANKEALKRQYDFGNTILKYPNTSKMTPDEIDKYPWKRSHWRAKAKEIDLPDPFNYGESLAGFANWFKGAI